MVGPTDRHGKGDSHAQTSAIARGTERQGIGIGTRHGVNAPVANPRPGQDKIEDMKKAVRFGILVAFAAYGLTIYLPGKVGVGSAPWPSPLSPPGATAPVRSPSSADDGAADTEAGFGVANLLCICNCVTKKCLEPAVTPRDLLSPCEQAVNNIVPSDSSSGFCVEQCLQDCGQGGQCAEEPPVVGGRVARPVSRA